MEESTMIEQFIEWTAQQPAQAQHEILKKVNTSLENIMKMVVKEAEENAIQAKENLALFLHGEINEQGD